MTGQLSAGSFLPSLPAVRELIKKTCIREIGNIISAACNPKKPFTFLCVLSHIDVCIKESRLMHLSTINRMERDGKSSLSVKNPDQEKSLSSSCMHDSLMCLSDALTTTHRAERPA